MVAVQLKPLVVPNGGLFGVGDVTNGAKERFGVVVVGSGCGGCGGDGFGGGIGGGLFCLSLRGGGGGRCRCRCR